MAAMVVGGGSGMDELKSLSVKNLKAIITEAGLECVGVVDREELIQLAATARGGDDPELTAAQSINM